eukprot:Gb_36982 [translate_table: standard]
MKGVYIFMGILLGCLHLWQVVNIHGHENLMVHNTVERLILKIYYIAGLDDSSAVMVGWAMENIKQRMIGELTDPTAMIEGAETSM